MFGRVLDTPLHTQLITNNKIAILIQAPSNGASSWHMSELLAIMFVSCCTLHGVRFYFLQTPYILLVVCYLSILALSAWPFSRFTLVLACSLFLVCFILFLAFLECPFKGNSLESHDQIENLCIIFYIWGTFYLSSIHCILWWKYTNS